MSDDVNTGGDINHLKVVCAGTRISLYANGHSAGDGGRCFTGRRPDRLDGRNPARLRSRRGCLQQLRHQSRRGRAARRHTRRAGDAYYYAHPGAGRIVPRRLQRPRERLATHELEEQPRWLPGRRVRDHRAGRQTPRAGPGGPRTDFDDFALEIDAHQISGPETGSAGLIFRFQDHDNFYFFMVDGQGRYTVGGNSEGDWDTLIDPEWESADAIKAGEDTNHLMVVCRGTEIELYANDELLITLDDDSFSSGKVGVIAETAIRLRPHPGRILRPLGHRAARQLTKANAQPSTSQQNESSTGCPSALSIRGCVCSRADQGQPPRPKTHCFPPGSASRSRTAISCIIVDGPVSPAARGLEPWAVGNEPYSRLRRQQEVAMAGHVSPAVKQDLFLPAGFAGSAAR